MVFRGKGLPRPGWLAIWARFLLRSVSRRHSAFLVALLAVTVGSTLAAAMLSLRADLRAKMSWELRRYGPNLLLTPGPGAVSPTLEEAWLRDLPAILSRERAGAGLTLSPFLLVAGRLDASPETASPAPGWTEPEDGGSPDRPGLATTLSGVDFETLARLNRSWRVEGVWPRTGEPDCLVGSSLARRLGLGPGSRAAVSHDSRVQIFTVSGILSTGESEEEQVLLPLADLQAMTGLSGRASFAALSVDGGAGTVRRAAAAIEREVRGVSARPLWQVAAAQGALLGKLHRLMLLLTLLVLLLCGLCVTTTFLSIVLEREREIGLMRSLGAEDREIRAMLLGEASLLGIVGGSAGLAAGAFAARIVGHRLFGAGVNLHSGVIPEVFAISLVLSWVAVLVPLRRALAVQPAAALEGD